MIEDVNFYCGKKPQAFKLNGKEFKVSTWSDMAVMLFEELYHIDNSIFETLAKKKFKNPNSPLISNNEYDILNRSKKLNCAEIYIEMHHSSASFIRFMCQVLKIYGLENNFEIIIGE